MEHEIQRTAKQQEWQERICEYRNSGQPDRVGRKNWLFCDTPNGAEASALAFSILEPAKANSLNPEAWPDAGIRFFSDPCG